MRADGVVGHGGSDASRQALLARTGACIERPATAEEAAGAVERTWKGDHSLNGFATISLHHPLLQVVRNIIVGHSDALDTPFRWLLFAFVHN